MDYTRFINKTSAARFYSPTSKLVGDSDIIPLSRGLPDPDIFPFTECQVTLRDGNSLSLDAALMKQALQYGQYQGYGPLLNWLLELQKVVHNPPTLGKPIDQDGLALLITNGAMDGISKTLEMILEPGDNILVASPCYHAALCAIKPRRLNILAVATDKEGIIPDKLRQVLSQWDPKDACNPESTIPKLLYTIPTGCNPTGAVMTYQRKKEVYQIAKEYNFIILEDDAYYFVQFGEERCPSFLSMDTDGRVIRLDSFSKVISAGLRIGFVSASWTFIERMILHQYVSNMQANQLGQILTYKLLEQWGVEGFLQHIKCVVDKYKDKRNAMLTAAGKWLTGLCEWDVPQAGMFLWVKVIGVKDTRFIGEKQAKKGVMVVPGFAYQTDEDEPSPYVRTSFSLVSPQDMDKGFARLAEVIKEELQKNNYEKIINQL